MDRINRIFKKQKATGIHRKDAKYAKESRVLDGWSRTAPVSGYRPI